jgi:hypothetical protein
MRLNQTMRIGYARVSTLDQNPELQLEKPSRDYSPRDETARGRAPKASLDGSPSPAPTLYRPLNHPV